MDNVDAIRFVNLIKEISGVNKPVRDNMVIGTVQTVSPLSVMIANSVIIEEDFLYLGQMCRPHKVTIPHTHQYNGQTEKATATKDGDLQITTVGQATTTVIEVQGHSHNIKEQVTEDVHKKDTDFETSVTLEIYPKLKKGDKVLMFAMNNFQKYYVAERLEE